MPIAGDAAGLLFGYTPAGSDRIQVAPGAARPTSPPAAAPARPIEALNVLIAAVLPPVDPPPPVLDLASFGWSGVLFGLTALVVSGFFATLRLALRQSHAPRILAAAPERRRERLAKLLDRADPLATSASVLSIIFRLLFFLQLLRMFSGEEQSWLDLTLTLVVAVPLHWLAIEGLPLVLAKRYGDGLLQSSLGAFSVLQWPFSFLSHGLEGLRSAFVRIVGMQDNSKVERQIVEGLRDVIAESEIDEDLDETERELIGNVMEFGDVDVAAVMTPRTEVVAVEVSASLLDAARALAASGHSRIPVFEQNLDTIVGTFSARDVIQVLAAGELAGSELRALVRPAYFVPETKPVSELLTEFRRTKNKIAIVLDEYGGTAGLVTIGDVLAEIVGEIPDESDLDEPHPFRRLSDGRTEIDATLHVSEVNEELGLQLPEAEDYETLAGFVLARLGRFPEQGEVFEHDGFEFQVTEASDRRVLKVCVQRLVERGA